MAAEQAWYIAERSEALATLFLTRRNDLEVIPAGRYGRSAGYDLLVRLKPDDAPVDMTFGIEVKGVRSEKRRGKSSFLVNYARGEIFDIGLPICVFLFAVDDEQGYYRWLFEPVISPHGKAELRFGLDVTPDDPARHEQVSIRSDFEPLTGLAIDVIIERVKHWYALKG
jgi:hypothetical protein